jgi:hypothetical protein
MIENIAIPHCIDDLTEQQYHYSNRDGGFIEHSFQLRVLKLHSFMIWVLHGFPQRPSLILRYCRFIHRPLLYSHFRTTCI